MQSDHATPVRCGLQDPFAANRKPLITNPALVTEVTYLLGRWCTVDHQVLFLEFLGKPGWSVENLMPDLPRIREFMERYRDLPADFTDASLGWHCPSGCAAQRSPQPTGATLPSIGPLMCGGWRTRYPCRDRARGRLQPHIRWSEERIAPLAEGTASI